MPYEFVVPESYVAPDGTHVFHSDAGPYQQSQYAVNVAESQYVPIDGSQMGIMNGDQAPTIILPSGEVVAMTLAMGADGMMYTQYMVPVALPQEPMQEWVGPPVTEGVSGYGSPNDWPKGLLEYLKTIDTDGEMGERSNQIYLETQRSGGAITRIVETRSSNGSLQEDGAGSVQGEVEVFI